MSDAFRKLAHTISQLTGSVGAFGLAFAIVLVWLLTGPVFAFSDTWQLIINTGTTIVTFLMVFLIQNTQNRDSHAIHAKLDELVIHLKGADNTLVNAEDLSDEDLDRLKKHFEDLASSAEAARTSRSKGKTAAGSNSAPKRPTPRRRAPASRS